MENKFREFIIAGTYMSVTLQDGGLQKFFVACSKIENTLITGDHVHTIEIAAVELLKAENASLKFQLLDRTEKYTIAMDKGVLELGDKISALKSKLKIASAALEVVKVHNGINAHYPIVYATVTQALRDVGEG